MPRYVMDVMEQIADWKKRILGVEEWRYDTKYCLKCDKDIRDTTVVKVGVYKMCPGCYKKDAKSSEDRLMSLINDIERLNKEREDWNFVVISS